MINGRLPIALFTCLPFTIYYLQFYQQKVVDVSILTMQKKRLLAGLRAVRYNIAVW